MNFRLAGDLTLDGRLSVGFLNGFTLSDNQQFLIGNIAGSRNGFFSGLGEGSLVGNFSGRDLFITYGAGNGNDVALITAVPEPGTILMLGTVISVGYSVQVPTKKAVLILLAEQCKPELAPLAPFRGEGLGVRGFALSFDGIFSCGRNGRVVFWMLERIVGPKSCD